MSFSGRQILRSMETEAEQSRISSSALQKIVIIVLVGSFIFGMLQPLWAHRRPRPSRPYHLPETLSSDVSCPVIKRDCTKRTQFGRVSCTHAVHGWPSAGGVLIKEEVDMVELDHLGLDRLKASSRSPNQEDEDRFCDRLRNIGAKWWSSEKEYVKVLLGARPKTAEEAQELVFGWPQDGGVWALSFTNQNERPKDFGRIHLARDMNERCQVIKEYGGAYFAKPEDCPYLQL